MATVDDMSMMQSIPGNRKLWSGAVGVLVLSALAGFGATQLTHIYQGNLKGIDAGDTAWVLAASALVMIMTPGVGFFYGGMVRSKNVVSAVLQSLVILALVSLQWILLGYSLAFGKDIFFGFLGGGSYWGLSGVGFAPNSDYGSTIPQLVHMIFQAMFAIITPALIIGAFAERMSFKPFIIFILLWCTLVYDPIAHWMWGADGWFHLHGVLDFAGGTVVHTSSGFSALAAAFVVGKRMDYQRGKEIEANNVPLTILGAVLLWFGWFGFNAGSALAASPLAASAFVATNTAAAAAALTWMALSWLQKGRPSATATATGVVCGLVVITPASGYVNPLSSIAIGALGGLFTYLAFFLRNKRMNVDDTLDVWAAHGIGGSSGVLLTGFFAEQLITQVGSYGHTVGSNGLFFGNPAQLVIQILAALAAAAWSFGVTWLLLKILLRFMKLRVSKVDERVGLDLTAHGEEGYRIEHKHKPQAR